MEAKLRGHSLCINKECHPASLRHSCDIITEKVHISLAYVIVCSKIVIWLNTDYFGPAFPETAASMTQVIYHSLIVVQDKQFNRTEVDSHPDSLDNGIVKPKNGLFHLISVPPCRGYMFLIVIPLRNSKLKTLYP